MCFENPWAWFGFRWGRRGWHHPFLLRGSAWKNNMVPLLTVSSGVRAKMGIILKALQQTSLLTPVSLRSKILLAAIYCGGHLTCWEEVWWLQKSRSMNQRFHVFCDLPVFSILLLSATSSSRTVQHFVLEKSIFLFSSNALLWTLLA